jgi:hypothetical protein
MLLKSFGCSFIFGNDLPDDGRDLPKSTPSRLTWPALLAKHHGYQYQCYARPGSGNLQIAETVLNQLQNIEPAVYVIGWTWIDRFDYNSPINDRWNTLMPVDTSDQAKLYYKHLHSQYRDKLTTLIHIKTVLDALQAVNAKFIMTYMDALIFETQWHCSPAVSYLQNSIRDSMTDFESKTFLEFSRSHDFPISDTWHPLESAHQAGFELISKSHSFL